MWRWMNSESVRPMLILVALIAALALWRGGLLGATGDQVIDDVRNRERNEVDRDLLTQNYYDVVLEADRESWFQRQEGIAFGSLLAKLYSPPKRTERLKQTEAIREIDGFLMEELVPDVDIVFKGAAFTTNRWGQRDRDYEQAKPEGAFRIAVVGGSNTMGSGVEESECYVSLVETRLNDEKPGSHEQFEVINFSAAGYHLLSRLYVVRERVRAFDPELILVTVTMYDLERAAKTKVGKVIDRDLDLEFDFIRDIVDRAGVESGDSLAKIHQRLEPYSAELVEGTMQEFRRLSDAWQTPIGVIILRLAVDEIHPNLHEEEAMARSAGILTFPLFDSYEGREMEAMYVSDVDEHPSVEAHALLADELYTQLLADPAVRALLGTDGP